MGCGCSSGDSSCSDIWRAPIVAHALGLHTQASKTTVTALLNYLRYLIKMSRVTFSSNIINLHLKHIKFTEVNSMVHVEKLGESGKNKVTID